MKDICGLDTVWEWLDMYTARLKVPGGWLVKGVSNGVHQIFVKDIEHSWEIR